MWISTTQSWMSMQKCDQCDRPSQSVLSPKMVHHLCMRYNDPMDQCRYNDPMDQCRYNDPMDQCRYNDPMDQCRYNDPMDQCRYNDPMDQSIVFVMSSVQLGVNATLVVLCYLKKPSICYEIWSYSESIMIVSNTSNIWEFIVKASQLT